ncbi:MAG: hypothetical protein HC873_12360 [Leptolyngbyaceae cyanobacterium SL_1_1]|nr:hypothetical protein [Leptolyngbyaceae cyanobacterium SL_1_1]
MVQQEIQQRSPEVTGFLRGTAIEVLSETASSAQNGRLRLTLELQFVAEH